MVVTRRAPVAPAPTSRTNSAQPIPRVKGKVPSGVTSGVSSPLANDTTQADGENSGAANHPPDNSPDASDKKGRGKSKGKQKKSKDRSRKKATSFVEFITRAFLLWFTIYTLSVCPEDDSLRSPVCRGLYHYRKLVLEPYLLPPVRQALAHPSVSPYVERAKPYVDRTIAVALPVAQRTRAEWNQRVVPQWQKRVVPQWNKHVVPQYQQHIEPYVTQVEQQVRPYVTRLQAEYELKVGPYLRGIAVALHKWHQEARPYVVLAAHKTYDGYQRAKPYAIPLLQRLQLLSLQGAQFLGEQRRQFVDPHVKKIWERVNELGSGDATPLAHVRSTLAASASKSSALVSSVVSSALRAPTPAILQPSEAVVGSASSVLPDVAASNEVAPAILPTPSPAATLKDHMPSASSIPSVVSSVAEDVALSASATASAATEKISSSASSIGSGGSFAPLGDIVPSVSSVSKESTASTVSSLAEQATLSALSLAAEAFDTVSYVAESVSSAVPKVASAASSAVHEVRGDGDDNDLDLAAILADLGLEGDLFSQDSEATESLSADHVVETETAEEKAEKRRLREEETARKRADITGRHAKWEADLEERIAKNKKALRHALVALRKAATAELKEGKEIRKEIEDLVEEAEKYLRGAEKYMATLRKESRVSDEKRVIWERVVEKVDKKFAERLTQTENLVNGWYGDLVQKELAEVRRLADEVKDIADRGQTDIGLDYAWLDDVTYHDWQRYHDLERASNNFLHHLLSVQNGSHPSPPVNPVLVALEDLQNEVQDVVVGFETRLRRIKRNGQRAFGGSVDELDSPEEPEDETVSILPIEDDTHKRMQDGESPAAPPVVIGRNPDEILSALDRAAEREAHATSTRESKSQDAEETVESMAQEVAAAGEGSTPASAASASPLPHEEL
ncbi:hypothetical protein PHLGIDRAFT_32086 [Phlebiopsis gigantea 11061_1 CR5-6]|uniref:Uncharacterized protein n=1 Tax=Phlebiopsis gigantea (strain 11061_1 CR5-6) TaxID=745531 RepID=A0A0C3S424_PHLG1|nr:hypothetical protein PHLGIDRAFT_32086 [Phlebiopsis gigantea 11061_1 CR5-6]